MLWISVSAQQDADPLYFGICKGGWQGIEAYWCIWHKRTLAPAGEVTVDGTINDNSDTDKGWKMEIAIPLILFDGVGKDSPVKAGNQ